MEEKLIEEKQAHKKYAINKPLIIGILLFVFFIGGGGYWLGKAMQRPEFKTRQAVPSPVRSVFIPSPSAQIANVARAENQDIYTFDGASIDRLLSITFHNPTGYLEYSPAVGSESVFYVDDNSIKSISIQTHEIKTIYENKSTVTHIRGVTFLEPNSLLIELGESGSTGGGGSYYAKYYFLFFDLSSQKTRRIGPFNNTQVYGDFSYLFSTPTGDDIIANGGGDGCGGGTEISRLKNNEQSVIIKAGAGCNPGDMYLGAIPDKNSILMVQRLSDENGPMVTLSQTEGDIIYDYGSIYLQDVNTGKKTTLFNVKTITDPVLTLYFDQSKQRAVIETKNNIIFLNKSNSAVANSLPKNDLTLDNPKFIGDNMYATDTQDRQLDVLSLLTGKLQEFPEITYFGGNEHDPSYFGIWHSQPLFFTTYYK